MSTEVIHGKASTYNRHRCRCPDCRQAATDYRRAQRHKHHYARERDRLKSQAYAAALRALKDRHADEFARLYAAERTAVGLPCEDPDAALLAQLIGESTPPFDVMRNELRACGYDLPPVGNL